MEPKVLNEYKDQIPEDAIYIGRPSKWGNPYVLDKDGDRDRVYEKYEIWLNQNEELKQQARNELKGKSLVCYCAPKRCHGDVLLKIANDTVSEFKMSVYLDPSKDGIDHLNIYTKAKTNLGRSLSNLSDIGFIHPTHGCFASVEAFWYWNSTGCQHNFLKSLSGFDAKKEGRKLPKVPNLTFDRDIEEAIKLKIMQNEGLLTLFKNSTLPFAHYYVYGNHPDQKVTTGHSSIWLSYFHNKLREQLKGTNNGHDLKVIIAGSRSIIDPILVERVIHNAGFNIGQLVCGMAARGVDMLGYQWAKDRHIDIKEFPADWIGLGKKAGMLRNFQMGDYADVLIAIWDGKSPGTKGMIDYMRKLNKAVYVLRTDIEEGHGG